MVQQLILKHVIGQVVELLLSQDLVLTTVASCTAGDRLASDGPVGIIDAIRAASAQNRHAWPSTSTHAKFRTSVFVLLLLSTSSTRVGIKYRTVDYAELNVPLWVGRIL